MKKYTSRGFRNYSEQKDSYGIPFVLRESSNAEMRACWLFIHDDEHAKNHLGSKLYPALHLSETNAKRIIKALEKFLEGQ